MKYYLFNQARVIVILSTRFSYREIAEPPESNPHIPILLPYIYHAIGTSFLNFPPKFCMYFSSFAYVSDVLDLVVKILFGEGHCREFFSNHKLDLC
jgi:hypothetical protein